MSRARAQNTVGEKIKTARDSAQIERASLKDTDRCSGVSFPSSRYYSARRVSGTLALRHRHGVQAPALCAAEKRNTGASVPPGHSRWMDRMPTEVSIKCAMNFGTSETVLRVSVKASATLAWPFSRFAQYPNGTRSLAHRLSHVKLKILRNDL